LYNYYFYDIFFILGGGGGGGTYYFFSNIKAQFILLKVAVVAQFAQQMNASVLML